MKFVERPEDAEIGEFIQLMDLHKMQHFREIYYAAKEGRDVEFRVNSNPNKIIRFRPHQLITGEFVLERKA